jgi:hypothetical protein
VSRWWRFLTVVHRDQDFLIVLDEIGGDGGVGIARRRSLAAREADLDGVGFAMFSTLSVMALTSSRE